MGVNIRQNGAWQNITFSVPGFSVGGEWSDETDNRVVETVYTNSTEKLRLVRASLFIDRNNNPSGDTFTPVQLAGTYAVGYVRESGTSSFIEVARYRDNGTANLTEVVVEVQLLVPQQYDYKVKLFDRDGVDWNDYINGNPVETKGWAEFDFQ